MFQLRLMRIERDANLDDLKVMFISIIIVGSNESLDNLLGIKCIQGLQ